MNNLTEDINYRLQKILLLYKKKYIYNQNRNGIAKNALARLTNSAVYRKWDWVSTKINATRYIYHIHILIFGPMLTYHRLPVNNTLFVKADTLV